MHPTPKRGYSVSVMKIKAYPEPEPEMNLRSCLLSRYCKQDFHSDLGLRLKKIGTTGSVRLGLE
eukprot:12792088-Ditylum_brightwellii.AAC.1